MKSTFGFLIVVSIVLPAALAEQPGGTESQYARFATPLRVKGGGEYIATESPGYACPCWHDVDGDGQQDLVVGQFTGGKMKVYRNLGDGKLAKGQWLKVDGKPAEVPGVW